MILQRALHMYRLAVDDCALGSFLRALHQMLGTKS